MEPPPCIDHIPREDHGKTIGLPYRFLHWTLGDVPEKSSLAESRQILKSFGGQFVAYFEGTSQPENMACSLKLSGKTWVQPILRVWKFPAF